MKSTNRGIRGRLCLDIVERVQCREAACPASLRIASPSSLGTNMGQEKACHLGNFSRSSLSSVRRKIDEDEVRVLTVTVEEDPLPVRRDIEASRDERPVQVREIAYLTRGQIEEREILQPEHAFADHQTFSIG